MRVAAVSRLVRRKFLEELYLSRAKCGDWDSLAFYLTRKNDWSIGREMRFFLAAVLRQQRRPPSQRTKKAFKAARDRSVLVYRARKSGAKNLEAAINKAAEQSGVEIRTIKRDLAEARSLLDLKKFKFKESDLMGVVRRLSQVNTGRDYDINLAALTERFMGPDTK